MMVLGVTHMHALGPRVPLAPPVSLSLMTTFIMYSEGIIPPSLPPSLSLSLTHVHHHHPSHHERGTDGEGLRDRGDACQMTKYCLLRLRISFDVLFKCKKRFHFSSVYSALFCYPPPTP